MGLSKETLRPETRMTFPPVSPGSSERKVNILPTAEVGLGARLHELSRMLFAESNKGEETEHQPQKETRTDGFEPFVNPQPPKDALFVNGYNGNFETKMELNRKGIERVLKIAHLEGQVFLVNLPLSRQSSTEIQGNELAAKRFLFFAEKTQKAEEENPYRRVVSIPDGWRIEINDGKIMEDLEEKRLTGEKLQTEFTQQFNRQLKQGLLACVLREKLTFVKDRGIIINYLKEVFVKVIGPSIFKVFLSGFLESAIIFWLGNSMGTFFNKKPLRHYDALWEHFIPLIEIDKVARSWAFLSLKGRKLVRETKSDAK